MSIPIDPVSFIFGLLAGVVVYKAIRLAVRGRLFGW